MERPLTEHIIPGNPPVSLNEYNSTGGYHILEKLFRESSPAEIITVVKQSNLMGRGGAGFPNASAKAGRRRTRRCSASSRGLSDAQCAWSNSLGVTLWPFVV